MVNDNCEYVFSELTQKILGCSFDVMNELGTGFLESVYKNALLISLKEKGLNTEMEKRFEVTFRGKRIGLFIAELIVENSVIVEIKCCGNLIGEHQAQTINYLKVANISVGLLLNFGKRKIEYKRLHHPSFMPETDFADEEPISIF